MDTPRRTLAYGIGALALSIGLILSGNVFGFIQTSNPSLDPGSPTVLSIMLTDPPVVPAGVTAVYLTYSDLEVHLVGLGDSGWVDTGSTGTIETTGLVNLSQTISTSDVPSGRYNLILFNISAAKIEFEGVNYTATVSSGKLLVPIVGGLVLNSSRPSGVVLDIQPTVLNIGSQSDPSFVITAGAKALQIPSGFVTGATRHLGFKMPLGKHAWFHSFVRNHSSQVAVSGVALSANSFSFTLTNPTSEPVTMRIVVLSHPSGGGHGPMPATPLISIIFVFGQDGSMRPLNTDHARGYTKADIKSALASSGLQLTAGFSTNFTFSGAIGTLPVGSTIVNGSSYQMTVIGDDALSVTTVVAG